MKNSRHSIVLIVISIITSLLIFILPICGFLFQCGCTWPWSDGATHCNIHDQLPPNCPWCVHHGIFGLLAGSVIFTCQLSVGFVILNWTGRIALASASAVFSLFPIAIIIGWLTKLF
ncbi:MAG: hypothetical protein MK025_09350 [Acidobacteriia bacterium]|nr:hypothetical protein [Terriglobia bacterium]